jgi:hypothetical protein
MFARVGACTLCQWEAGNGRCAVQRGRLVICESIVETEGMYSRRDGEDV